MFADANVYYSKYNCIVYFTVIQYTVYSIQCIVSHAIFADAKIYITFVKYSASVCSRPCDQSDPYVCLCKSDTFPSGLHTAVSEWRVH